MAGNFEKERKRRGLAGLWIALAFGAGLAVGLMCKGGFGCNNGNTTNHYHWSEEDFPIPDAGADKPSDETESCECADASEDADDDVESDDD